MSSIFPTARPLFVATQLCTGCSSMRLWLTSCLPLPLTDSLALFGIDHQRLGVAQPYRPDCDDEGMVDSVNSSGSGLVYVCRSHHRLFGEQRKEGTGDPDATFLPSCLSGGGRDHMAATPSVLGRGAAAISKCDVDRVVFRSGRVHECVRENGRAGSAG